MFPQHFFITLPSNTVSTVDWKGRKENTLNEFRVTLPQRVSVPGDYEVALAEIMYPMTIPSVNGRECTFSVTFLPTTLPEDDGIPNPFTIDCELPPKNYSTEDELCKALTEVYQENLDDAAARGHVTTEAKNTLGIRFLHHETARSTQVRIHIDRPDQVRMSMNKALCYMLGFRKLPDKMISEIVGEYPVDLNVGCFAIYCYSDLVQNQMVGNSLVPLLRAVPLEGQHGDIVCRSFNPYHYLPLAKREFNTVEISLRDDRGRRVNFTHGKVLVTLHFRRKEPGLYDLGSMV